MSRLNSVHDDSSKAVLAYSNNCIDAGQTKLSPFCEIKEATLPPTPEVVVYKEPARLPTRAAEENDTYRRTEQYKE